MPIFQYPELDLAKNSIRILRIAKGSLLDDISCELIESLPNAKEWPTYNALSYTWGGLKHTPGGPNHLPRVLVNRHEFDVTESLFLALQHIRSLDEDVYLWADAICINQQNKKEKGHQVRQMRDVYKTAEEVFIWLGLSNEDIKDLMESISWIDHRASMAQARGNSGSWMDLCRDFLMERLGSLGSQPHLRQGQALAELLGRQWFKRVWILQEVAMAKKARIICGSHSCPARTFALMPSLMGLEVNEHTQAILDIMPRLRNNTWWSSSRYLHKLLLKFASSEATDKRDKIYALLGMSADAHDSARFYPSYEKTATQVFRDTVCFLLFGEILDSNHYFPDFALQDLCLPIPQLAEKTLSSALGQSEERRESAHKTVGLLILRLNEGQLKTPDIRLSLAKKQGEGGRVQRLLSNGNVNISVDFEGNQDVLRIIPREENAESLGLIFPRLEPSRQTREEPPFQFSKDENMTETIKRLIEAGASNEELLRAYAWAGDSNAVGKLIADGVDVNGADSYGRTALVYVAKALD